MNRLNFGCGSRIAEGWVNVDFDSSDPRVRAVNLLKRLPFSDDNFDAVYSSHVLEHFSPEQGRFLLAEAERVLRPGGVLRIVVPDLEGSCREYLRVLDLEDTDPAKADQHEWMTVELLDQLVRSVNQGQMGPLTRRIMDGQDAELIAYVNGRIGSAPSPEAGDRTLGERLRRLTPGKFRKRFIRLYLMAVSHLVPRGLRNMVFLQTGIGERHRWMYDRYSLKGAIRGVGLVDCTLRAFDESEIPEFTADLLDSNPDGSAYKNNSIYIEARKP